MKKRTLLLSLAAVGALATVAGCGGGDKAPDLSGREMNLYVNYQAKSGVTFSGTGETSYTNPFDNVTYTKGDLLPMWKQLGENLNCKIKDAVIGLDNYVAKDDAAQLLQFQGTDLSKIDMVMMNSANAATLAGEGKLLNLNKYLDHMPNYKKFLDANPTIKSEMTNTDGEMFMVPYFDGLNSPEHYFLMNVELVEAVLDSADTSAFDTTAVAGERAYKTTIDTSKDYKIGVSKDAKAQTITVKAAKNPVTAQNEGTQTGKGYADALRTYIDTAYAELFDKKIITKRSEVFTSESACYSTDDLVALLRVVVNNSKLLKHEGKVYGFIPREGSNSRIDSVLWLMQIFGVQGIRGMTEKDALYYDKDGQLQDGRVQEASFNGLEKLHELYQEGLIVPGFEVGDKKNYTQSYLTGKDGAALMMFDYTATQCAWNKVDANGIGNKDSEYSKIRAVLPPVTKWANDNLSNKDWTYTRYLESSRANKGSGSVIPLSSDENTNIARAEFVDYFYSTEGAELQDFGPEAYRDGTINIGGKDYVAYNKKVFQEVAKGLKGGGGWNDYCRYFIGTTQGIGHVRSDAVDYQFTNEGGRPGNSNVAAAINAGVVIGATSSRKAGFGACVPSQWSSNPTTDQLAPIANLTDFWGRGVGDSNWRYVVIHGWTGMETGKSRSDLLGLASKSNDIYLKHYRTLLDLKKLS